MADLISEDYLHEQILLHGCGYYGAYSSKWITFVTMLMRALKVSSVLDYGCGHGKLVAGLVHRGLAATGYDPAVEQFKELPAVHDLVFCSDVLEHIEPDKLGSVLEHIDSVASRFIYVVIATRPATRRLSDGRNAHLIVESGAWWRLRLQDAGWTERRCPVINSIHNPALELACLWMPRGQL
jgi:Methyltransferase domain